MFIVFEGVDGSGKSTQLRLLADRLTQAGFTVTTTREPGGANTIGAAVRQMVLHPLPGQAVGRRAETLLFAADRAEHVDGTIRPALEAGHIVLCDRFSDSTLAYQGIGRGLGLDDVVAVCRFAEGGLQPDLVIVLDLPADSADGRVDQRGAADRLEDEIVTDALRPYLRDKAQQDPSRYALVDAVGTIEDVAERVWAALAPRLS